MLKTERLILRHWEDSDAEDLYEYAKDPDVGPVAGWPAHRNIEESRNYIRSVFSGEETYAICLKKDSRAIGAVGLNLKDQSGRTDECELGYWIGKPFWGQGLVPEASEEVLRHAFEDLHMGKVWCCTYVGNTNSQRVQQKLGFCNPRIVENVDVPLLHEKRDLIICYLSREQWQQDRLNNKKGATRI